MLLSSGSRTRPLAVLAFLALSTLARAQVTITCDQLHVTTRNRTPDAVHAPALDGTDLQVVGTAPAGTDRVGMALRVVHGHPGAEVAFQDVAFHQVP